MHADKATLTLIGLTNPQSPSNVGSVLRAAGCFRAETILYTGERFDRAREFHTDTQKANVKIDLRHCDDFFENLPEGVETVCIDLIEGATPLPEFKHPDKALYIFGPEDSSVDQSTIDKADHVVYIPTVGCLNLAATTNIVMYDRTSKQQSIEGSDALIRQSRDKNNATKVR